MQNWFYSFVDWFIDKYRKKCPAAWHECNLEDCDEGCHLGGDCGDKLFCFYPKFIIKLMVKRQFNITEKYFKEHEDEI